jgi:hypothetical protein
MKNYSVDDPSDYEFPSNLNELIANIYIVAVTLDSSVPQEETDKIIQLSKEKNCNLIDHQRVWEFMLKLLKFILNFKMTNTHYSEIKEIYEIVEKNMKEKSYCKISEEYINDNLIITEKIIMDVEKDYEIENVEGCHTIAEEKYQHYIEKVFKENSNKQKKDPPRKKIIDTINVPSISDLEKRMQTYEQNNNKIIESLQKDNKTLKADIKCLLDKNQTQETEIKCLTEKIELLENQQTKNNSSIVSLIKGSKEYIEFLKKLDLAVYVREIANYSIISLCNSCYLNPSASFEEISKNVKILEKLQEIGWNKEIISFFQNLIRNASDFIHLNSNDISIIDAAEKMEEYINITKTKYTYDKQFFLKGLKSLFQDEKIYFYK